MGSGSSREAQAPALKHPKQQYHDDGLFSQAAMARRADKIRQMFPIATPADDASSPVDYTAFTSSGAFALSPLDEDERGADGELQILLHYFPRYLPN